MMLFQRLIAATLCFGLLTFSAYGGAELEQRIPADALVVATWEGKGIVFNGSVIGQSLNKLQPLKLLMQVSPDTIGPKTPEMISFFADIAAHPCALTITDMTAGSANLVFLSKLGKDAKPVLAKMKSLFSDRAITTTQVSGVPFNRAEGGIYFGLLPGTDILLVGNGGKMLAPIINQTPETSFAKSKIRAAYLKPLTDQGAFTQAAFLVNVSLLNAKLEAVLKEKELAQYKKFMPALGLDKTEAIAWTMQFKNKQILSTARIYSPAPHRGVLGLLNGPALTPEQLANIPADADFFLAANVPVKTVWNELMHTLKQTAGVKRQQRAEKQVNAAFEKMELSFQKNVLDAIGDTWVISSAVSQGGWMTGTVLSVDIKNPIAFGQLMMRMEGLLGGAAIAAAPAGEEFVSPIRTIKVGKTVIRYYQDSRLLFAAPSWMVYKGRFYIAGWPQVLQSVVENKTPALATKPDFTKQWKTALPKPCSMMGYVNTPMMNRDLYPLALIMKTGIKNALIQKNPGKTKALADLNLIGSIQQEVTSTIPYFCGVCPDKKGVTIRSYGSGGETQLLLPVLFGAFGRMQMTGEKRFVEFNMSVRSKSTTTQPATTQSSKPQSALPRYYCLETKKVFTIDPSKIKESDNSEKLKPLKPFDPKEVCRFFSPYSKKRTGVPMVRCPACGEWFAPESYIKMNPEMPVVCTNPKCKTDLNEWYREQRRKRRQNRNK